MTSEFHCKCPACTVGGWVHRNVLHRKRTWSTFDSRITRLSLRRFYEESEEIRSPPCEFCMSGLTITKWSNPLSI
jgi:hypothetical protein